MNSINLIFSTGNATDETGAAMGDFLVCHEILKSRIRCLYDYGEDEETAGEEDLDEEFTMDAVAEDEKL